MSSDSTLSRLRELKLELAELEKKATPHEKVSQGLNQVNHQIIEVQDAIWGLICLLCLLFILLFFLIMGVSSQLTQLRLSNNGIMTFLQRWAGASRELGED